MIFSSNFFLYIFFPLFLMFYFIAFKLFYNSTRAVNYVILLFSVIFYFFTGGLSIVLLFGVVGWNYFWALLIEKNRKKSILAVAVGGNILLFLCFKYTVFIYENAIFILQIFSKSFQAAAINIILPVGISFYIFQALSYVVDVYRKDIK